MINLIPNEEKKRKVKDFYFRLSVVLFTILGFSFVVAALSIMPSYFLTTVKINFISQALQMQENQPVTLPDQQTNTEIADLQNKLRLFEKNRTNTYLVSKQVIDEILSKKMSDIKIMQIGFNDSPDKGKIINITGIAGSRERLLLFRQALSADPVFKKVDLPVSNFVKGSNITFSITLIPA